MPPQRNNSIVVGMAVEGNEKVMAALDALYEKQMENLAKAATAEEQFQQKAEQQNEHNAMVRAEQDQRTTAARDQALNRSIRQQRDYEKSQWSSGNSDDVSRVHGFGRVASALGHYTGFGYEGALAGKAAGMLSGAGLGAGVAIGGGAAIGAGVAVLAYEWKKINEAVDLYNKAIADSPGIIAKQTTAFDQVFNQIAHFATAGIVSNAMTPAKAFISPAEIAAAKAGNADAAFKQFMESRREKSAEEMLADYGKEQGWGPNRFKQEGPEKLAEFQKQVDAREQVKKDAEETKAAMADEGKAYQSLLKEEFTDKLMGRNYGLASEMLSKWGTDEFNAFGSNGAERISNYRGVGQKNRADLFGRMEKRIGNSREGMSAWESVLSTPRTVGAAEVGTVAGANEIASMSQQGRQDQILAEQLSEQRRAVAIAEEQLSLMRSEKIAIVEIGGRN